MKRVRPRCAQAMGTQRPVNPESCAPVCPRPRRAHRRARDHSPIGAWAHLYDDAALEALAWQDKMGEGRRL
jgi:hypothetical protein